MEEKLKELFISKMKSSHKKEADVSSYTIIRSGTGLFTMKIYWKGKAKSQTETSINIRLNNNIESSFSAIKAMESIINDGSMAEIDFEQKIKTQKDAKW